MTEHINNLVNQKNNYYITLLYKEKIFYIY